MTSQFLVSSVPFGAFERRLRLVASIAQPLQIIQRMIVSGNDVVAIGPDPIAILRVDSCFAASMSTSLDHGPALLPIVGEPESPVTAVPVHLIAHPPPSTHRGQVAWDAFAGIRTLTHAAGTIHHWFLRRRTAIRPERITRLEPGTHAISGRAHRLRRVRYASRTGRDLPEGVRGIHWRI